ncbi:reverse transcriptase zinc-binding domain-containing protein [Tanacetum coccineum]
MIVNNKWRWPEEWMERYPILTELEVHKLEESKGDRTMGKSTNDSLMEFSSKVVWELLSQQHTLVRWNKVVWHSQCNPRLAFILWMAIKGRLQTQDRIMVWSNDSSMECPLSRTYAQVSRIASRWNVEMKYASDNQVVNETVH